MIYVDTSIVLAELFAEDQHPPAKLWDEELISSRLLEYEIWNAIHRRAKADSHGEAARQLLESFAIAELSRDVLRRAIERFPVPVRTLDALHLSTILFLGEQGLDLELASYDVRMIEGAQKLAIPLAAM
ncbi:MAG: PIN domain-containing protein [Acidobacteria bacterium]|nr:PIN domain-containing protein [Acidobacteriota bacterium]